MNGNFLIVFGSEQVTQRFTERIYENAEIYS